MKDEPKIMSVQISTEDPEEVDYKDLYIRLLADFQNYKRRNSEQLLHAGENAVFDFVKELAPILDDLELCLPHEKGIHIIFNEIMHLLSKYGVKQYSVKVGDKFDPEIHDAVYLTINKKVESGCVSEVLKNGYRTDDKIIRYAKVNVEK